MADSIIRRKFSPVDPSTKKFCGGKIEEIYKVYIQTYIDMESYFEQKELQVKFLEEISKFIKHHFQNMGKRQSQQYRADF